MQQLFYTISLLLLLSSFPVAGVEFVSAERPIKVVQEFDYDVALKTSQSAIGKQLVNHKFTNANGEPVSLEDFRGKPLVLSMVYTSCYQICPMTTRHLSRVVEKARDAMGEDSFSVVVIGFDTAVDTPEAMQYFANKQGISDKNWNLLSINEEDLEALVEDLGFLYYPTSSGFDHLIQATVIDADGKVYRQVYGQVFDTPLLVDPLLELVLGRPQPEQSLLSVLNNKIKLFCTVYDPRSDGYYYNYSFFVEIFVGITVIVGIIMFMRREIKKGRKVA
ncbi:MAG: SCO family protein [Gammaproteobacteria bacterium]|nr:SCO family protein [Gammaproteobacteria bacterium]